MAHFVTDAPIRRIMLTMLSLCVVLLGSCSKPTIVDGKAIVDLDGTNYTLDIVADDATRERGLGGVTELPEHGGMLFVFPDSRMRAFVMRDCVIDIDIIFLDPAGRIVAMHHMPIEEPKAEDESQLDYERRLKKYSSRFSAKFVIEIAGGRLKDMDLKEGEQINLDLEYLDSIVQ
ncbi:MAG: DUF192 domain-containing protein [Phycisphaerales bacterium]